MRLTPAIFLAGFLIAGCAHNGDDASAMNANGEIDGQAAYLEHCAGCHDDGLQGAPRLGVSSEWQGRSTLWQAVLMDDNPLQ